MLSADLSHRVFARSVPPKSSFAASAELFLGTVELSITVTNHFSIEYQVKCYDVFYNVKDGLTAAEKLFSFNVA